MSSNESITSSQLPHYSASEFASEKRKHLTDIRNSPPRYDRVKPQHPYEPNQPNDPHYSLEDFESEKRRHRTEIRNSPRRSEGRVRIAPPTVTDLIHKEEAPYHVSHQEFSIEKSEHFTPILPVQPKQHAEPRSPDRFRHTSNHEMQREVSKCKTPIYPVPTPESQRRHRVVDNYLNYNPHPEGFLHTSIAELTKEKKGHLTDLHLSGAMRERARSASQEPRGPSPADYDLFTSAQTLQSQKVRHATDLHTSTHRSRSADVKHSLAPQYSSVQRFSHDKARHLATHSPQRQGRIAAVPKEKYTSVKEYTHDKRRHSASPQPLRSARARTPDHSHYCSHTSNRDFSSEKRRHITDVHNSPVRDRKAPPQRSPSAMYTSNAELQRAKRGHHISVGSAGAGRSASQQRVHKSNEHFSSEKRGHHTGIGNVYTPPSPNLQPSQVSGFKSHSKFSDSKRLCKADLSPPRRSVSRGASASPQRFVSQAQFRGEKAKHAVLLDSPLRREPPTPSTPPTVRSTYSNRSRDREHRTPSSNGERAPSYDRESRRSRDSRDYDREPRDSRDSRYSRSRSRSGDRSEVSFQSRTTVTGR